MSRSYILRESFLREVPRCFWRWLVQALSPLSHLFFIDIEIYILQKTKKPSTDLWKAKENVEASFIYSSIGN